MAQPLPPEHALLFLSYDGPDKTTLMSVTVFCPYTKTPPPEWANDPEWYPTRFPSAFGDVDITYSHGATYLVIDQPDSGFHTGVALPNEVFSIHPQGEAHALAKQHFPKHGR